MQILTQNGYKKKNFYNKNRISNAYYLQIVRSVS